MCPHSYRGGGFSLMIRLSAFADEISGDLNEQIAVLQAEHIQYINLRSVWGMPGTSLSFCLGRDKAMA
jgi:hypothetical protein